MVNKKAIKYTSEYLPNNNYFEKLGINPYEYSVLALSVYKANIDFIENYTQGKILEIGCGSDSIIHEKLKPNWFGIDVAKMDRHGKPSLASKFASVHDIPYSSESFDIVISNQSIEHWFEYNIRFEEAFNEINRVLKPNGNFIFNFPVHLHGHKYFVLNKLDKINEKLKKTGFEIIEIKEFKANKKYKGWLKCGFPTLYLKLFSDEFKKTSFVVEYKVKKITKAKSNTKKSNKFIGRKSNFSKRLHHGLLVVLFSIFRKLFKLF